ncbi:uncharacterized protein LOC143904287 [Temnothorax americanus]|uniref:uncharacterized protein LOC143904287 n=1 Tax=Temnothorax americanus TaxID=1964332 RepID=UPI0040675DE9
MNLVAFGLILICCHAWATEIDDNFGEVYALKSKLADALEKFKSVVRDGDSNLGIPALDPFITDRLPLNINEPGIGYVDGVFTNVHIDGFSSYKVNNADFKLFGLKVHVDLTWSLVVLNTNYSAKANVFDFDIYGTGGIEAAAHDFRFLTDIGLKLKGKYVQIESISTKVSLRALDFHATGLYDDNEISEVVSKTISDAVPKLIDTNQKVIVDTINRVITEEGNKYLSTVTFKDLLKILGL